MPKRSGKKKQPTRDVNEMAHAVIDHLASDTDFTKDPAAVALGRKGGLKGGRVRMDALSPAERRKLALKAAKARWGK